MQAKELETELDAAFIEVEYQISVDSCKDHDVSPWLGLAFMVFTRLKHCNLSVSHASSTCTCSRVLRLAAHVFTCSSAQEDESAVHSRRLHFIEST